MSDALATDADLGESLEYICEKLGFPTFEQFRANPELLRGRKDEFFELIDKNVNPFGVTKHEYYWRGLYKVDSLEKCQRIAADEGFEGCELEMQVFTDRRLGDPNDYDKDISARVHVFPKEEVKAMGGIVANE